MFLVDTVKSHLSPTQKRYLKRKYFNIRARIINQFYSYSPPQLENKLRKMGLADGDTILAHSSFSAFNGFKGDARQIIDCILNIVGISGNVAMMSMAYTGSSYDYLKACKPFDVQKTISRMGIITESFRRREGVLRSTNALHPILAVGPRAEWLVAGHDKITHSCGAGSPFEKLLQLNSKVLFFDVSFLSLSFLHYLEDFYEGCAPVKVYRDELLESIVIDTNGEEIRVKTFVFGKEAIQSRNFSILEDELRVRNLITTEKIGNTRLMLTDVHSVVDCAREIVESGRHFYHV
jgi:aminoglycoside 3-N-acetyltransferase